MRIGWVADYDVKTHPGGAQQTNQLMLDWAKENGIDVKLVTKETISIQALKRFDVLIVNNLHVIKQEKPEIIDFIVNATNYIRYEHDYFGDKQLFENSIGNVFLSPLHYRECKKTLGLSKSRPYFIQPSPINTNIFKPLKHIKRRPNLVFWVGQVAAHKGVEEVLAMARSQPMRQFVFATIPQEQYWKEQVQAIPNCYAIGFVDHDKLPIYYNYAQYFVHLPRWKEPFGRTVIEAYLCGCDLIVNDNVGALSFDIDYNNYNEVKSLVEPARACKHFWNNIFKLIRRS